MILYFTGTGNSEYAAKKLAAALGEETMPLMERIRHNDTSPLESETPWIVCTPTYAWQLPHIVRDHLRRTLLRGSKEIYFVMTCGGEIGEAGKYAAELCAEKYLTYRGCARVIMPENYIVMFDVPDEGKARGIVAAADPMLDRLAELIRERKPFPQPKVSAADKLKSGVVNKAFYPLLVHAKQFTVNEKCTGCGLCAKLCPTCAITLHDGHPVWEDNCTHCMACITRCPAEAIEYGKKSLGEKAVHFLVGIAQHHSVMGVSRHAAHAEEDQGFEAANILLRVPEQVHIIIIVSPTAGATSGATGNKAGLFLVYLIDQLPNGLFVEAHIGDGGEQPLDHQPPSPLIHIRSIIYRTGQSNQSDSQLILKLRHLSGFSADAGFSGTTGAASRLLALKAKHPVIHCRSSPSAF